MLSLWLLVNNNKSEHTMALCLFLLHLSRRLYECLHITIYGDSKIHIAGYIAGILHYVLVPISIARNYQSTNASLTLKVSSIAMFIIANIMQFQFHYILYLTKLKMKSNHRPMASDGTNGSSGIIYGFINGSNDGHNYPLPKGIGFDSVCCPHYTAEIIIYISLWMVDINNHTTALVSLWVVANLSVVANLQFQWYQERYRHELMAKRRHWRRLIPGGWWVCSTVFSWTVSQLNVTYGILECIYFITSFMSMYVFRLLW